ncbi:MAG TPA: NUDIX domain-containing protein [Streptosporangiaceae bacterium]|nr:NUDIX domain-containing protein [Streptosporangiaceae bacterium]
MEVPRVAVSADLVILTVRASQLCVLVWRRHAEPHLGRWALPGGFIRLDEDLPATASRVLAERAGLPDAPVHLEQLQTYGYPDRDPRARVVAVAYLGLAPDLPAPAKPRMSWQPVDGLSEMAFDHLRILQDGVERARAKLEYTTLGAAFCRDTFTVAELRKVYEIVWGTPLDPRNFHRKVTGAERFLVDTGTAISSGGRPAVLYQRGDTDVLHPPMLRPRPAPRLFQGVEPVRQSPGGPVDVTDGEGQRATPGQVASRYAPQAGEHKPAVPTRPGGSGGSFPGSDREDNDVRADTTVPTDS